MAIPQAASGEDLVRWSTRASAVDAQDKALFARIRAVPASSIAAGQTNDIAFDANYLYVCIAPNTWRRVALSTF